ncbi:hypothetical protein AB0G32_38525 [Streptomyces sp. NPDC023723]|uniref:hypothetical protein n=1 Tax=Streptomyces sp. NPDC023723 TaxID=3154323 RepID=UPI0033C0E2D9
MRIRSKFALTAAAAALTAGLTAVPAVAGTSGTDGSGEIPAVTEAAAMNRAKFMSDPSSAAQAVSTNRANPYGDISAAV